MSKVESAPLPPLPGTATLSLTEKDRAGVNRWIDGRLKDLLTGDGSYRPDGPKLPVSDIYDNVKNFLDKMGRIKNEIYDPLNIVRDKIKEHEGNMAALLDLKDKFESNVLSTPDRIQVAPPRKGGWTKTPIIDPRGEDFPASYTGQYEINALKSIVNRPSGAGEAEFRPIERNSLFNSVTLNEISRQVMLTYDAWKKYEKAFSDFSRTSKSSNKNYWPEYKAIDNLRREAQTAFAEAFDFGAKILGVPLDDLIAPVNEAIKALRKQQETIKVGAAAKAEAERQAAAKAEAERQAAAKAEAERQAAAKAEAERQAAAKAEAERQAAAKAEAERQEAARQEAARAEAARRDAERAEAARREAAARAERDRLAFEEGRRQSELQMQRHLERLRQEEQFRKESQERQRQWDLQRQREAEEQRRRAAADQARRDAEQERLRREMDSIRIIGAGNGRRPAPGIPVPQPRPGPVPTPRPSWRPGFAGAPVVLDLNNDGRLDLTTLPSIAESNGVSPAFDWNGDDLRDRTAWIGPNDGLLVIDLGKNDAAGPDGQINRPEEVAFSLWKSEEQRVAELKAQGIDDTGRPVTDLEGLRFAFDTNHDNILDNRDARWSEFRIWQDFNQNGATDEGELSTMEAEGITFIDLLPLEQGAKSFPDGSMITGTSSAKRIDGTSILVGDVALAYRPSQSGL
ncbi:hypothetical protein [Rhizobium sp. AN70]|uniref:hypothetical protein n=1 Tax=Rhizobium sp. AN70 TaxID=3035123 RepID=UPI00247A87AC|nr:hypothetical protein [Rhizobium sp. AN70]MDH7804242.1 hypothetical protein [Rhizobium sp. AN70]